MADTTLKPMPSHGMSLDELLASAKATLGRADQFAADQAGAVTARNAEAKAAESLTPMGTAKRYGKPVVDALKMAAIPASFLGGPVGAIAGGSLALEGLQNAVENPSAGSVGLALLGALPSMKLLRGGKSALTTTERLASQVGKLSKEERMMGKAGAQARQWTGASKEVPYRMGGSTQGPSSTSVLDEMVNPSAGISGSRADMLNPDALARAEEMGNRTRADLEFADTFGNDAGRTRQEVGRRFGGTQVEVNPPASFEDQLTTAQSSGQGPDAVREIEQYLAQLGFEMPTGSAATEAVSTRPAADFIHPADTAGAKFGFDELPEISDSELTRLQALFARLQPGRR